MSVALFQRLCSIRAFRVESAHRECLRLQEVLAQREQALRAAVQSHAQQEAAKHARAARWRADRLSLATFDTQASDGHWAELARCDHRIEKAAVVVRERRAEYVRAANALQTAKEALARRRVELTKAETGVSKHRTLAIRRDEAIEEDELDELAELRPRSQPMEHHT